MRWLILSVFVVSFSATIEAHHPERQCQPVHQRIDVIGPIGNWLPMSHRRRYNRPSNIGGKIAYYIAPSSQEAMAWHDATHRGLYENDRPRMAQHFFYPKPWEALQIGTRHSKSADGGANEYPAAFGEEPSGEPTLALPVDQPIVSDRELIEQ